MGPGGPGMTPGGPGMAPGGPGMAPGAPGMPAGPGFGGPPQFGPQVGQAGPYPYGPPGGAAPPPKGSGKGWKVAGIVVGVLVVAGLGGYLLFGERPSPTTPPPPAPTDGPRQPTVPRTSATPLGPEQVAAAREHAAQYVAAINAKDEAAATALTCDKDLPGGIYLTGVASTPVTLADEPKLVDVDRAVFEVLIDGKPFPVEIAGPDAWCVFI
ncbi:DUF6479 family protein [Actinokineospora sp. NPDC004072]